MALEHVGTAVGAATEDAAMWKEGDVRQRVALQMLASLVGLGAPRARVVVGRARRGTVGHGSSSARAGHILDACAGAGCGPSNHSARGKFGAYGIFLEEPYLC